MPVPFIHLGFIYEQMMRWGSLCSLVVNNPHLIRSIAAFLAVLCLGSASLAVNQAADCFATLSVFVNR